MMTRSKTSLQPPPLLRTSAMITVRFTPNGRRMARRMMIQPTNDPVCYYWFTGGDTKTHHFLTSDGIFRIHGNVTPEVEVVDVVSPRAFTSHTVGQLRVLNTECT